MDVIVGHVDGVNGKGVKVGDKWYNAFSESTVKPLNKGDLVEFNCQVNGKWNNIKGAVKVLEKVSGGGSSVSGSASPSPDAAADLPPHFSIHKGYVTKTTEYPLPSDHPDNVIINQNALTNAVSIVTIYERPDDAMDVIDKVLVIARAFAEFSSGRMSAEKHLEALKKLTEAE